MVRTLGTLALLMAVLVAATAAHGADNFFTDLVVDETGYLAGDADDRYFVSGDFLNASKRSVAWLTVEASLIFQGGSSHVCEVAGKDHGNVPGLASNFGWGELRLGSGQSLVLQDGNAAPGGGQYVRRLVLEDGTAQIASITGNGNSIYYDTTQPANAYLSNVAYSLSGGGVIAPFVPGVPAVGAHGLVLLAWALAVSGLWLHRGRDRCA